MRAVTFDQPGAASVLTLGDVPDPQPGVGEVLIDVHAARAQPRGSAAAPRALPAPAGASEILGLECAGVIAALGPGAAWPPRAVTR